MTNHLNTIKPLTVFEPCRSLVSKAVNKALPLVLISPLILSSELSFAAQLTPNPNEVGNTITVSSTEVSNDLHFDNSGTIRVNTSGSLTNNASLKNHVGGTLSFSDNAGHIEGKHNAFTNVGSLENNGTINLSAYQNFLVNHGVVNNEAGGLINIYNSNAHYNNNLRLHNANTGVLNNKAGATIILESSQSSKYLINDGVVNNDGSITTNGFAGFYNSGQFYNNAGASLTVNGAKDDNKVGVLTNAGDASLSKWRNSYKLAQTIENSGTLILEKLTLTRPLTNLSGGTLTTKGNGAASVTFADNNPNSGSLYNSGTWLHNSGQSLKNEALIQNNSDGTINLSGYLNNAATFTNAGTLTLNSGSDLYGTGSFDQTMGTTLLNSQLAADGGVNFTGGLLTGDGRVILAANTLQIEEQAEVNPGTGVGTLSVTGNVAFNGQLTIELDAKEQGSFDELAVTGDINFGVASDVVFDFNFAVTEEFTIDFATAGSISNLPNLNYTFNGLSSGYAVVVDESASKLQLQVRIDTDGDKIADLVDEDDDNDGYTDIDEAANGTSLTDANSFPNDNDGDFISDLTDTDDDNDGVLDDDDAFPFDASESKDTDGDGIGDNAEIDADDDGINNDVDVDDDNDNLIEIRTLVELDEIRNNLSGTRLFGSNLGCLSVCEGFELSNDLDFDTSGDGIVDENDDYWNSGLGWSPIGSADSAFTAIIDGNFNTIRKLTINRTTQAKVGLFAFVDSNAQLKNLTLADVDINGKENVGSLVGNIKQSLVENISATGSLSAGRTVAGIIGVSQQTQMSKVSFVGRVTAAANNAGGIVAISELSTIEQAFHIGPVTATAQSVGGITGSSSSNISDVFSVGVITGGQSVGGIVGHMGSANLDRSFSLSTINADSNAGAIIGYGESSGFSSSYRSDAVLLSSVGAGDITDTSTTLTTLEFTCPQSSGDTDCSAVIYADWDDATPVWDFGDANDYPGLLINGVVYRVDDYDNDGSHDNVDLFPLDDSESTDNDGDGTGDNADLDDDNDGYTDTDELANGTSLTDKNDIPSDNDGDFISDLNDIDDDNDGYTDLDEVANGTSTTDANDKPLADQDGDYISDLTDIDDDNDNLIEISSLADLDEIRNNLAGTRFYGSNLGCLSTCEGFELKNDLDFDTNGDGSVDINDAYFNGGEGWQPIGSSSGELKSHFNGNGYAIKNLTINRPSKAYQGLFGKISQVGAVLNNLTLTDIRVVGSSATGGLAGSVNGLNIYNVTVTGHVKGADYVGGIIGNSLNSDISLSAHIGNVSAQNKAGGIIGATSNGNISQAYHIGVVDGDESAGGLVGSSLGNITDSYSAGFVTGNDSVGGIAGYVYGSDNGDTFSRNYSVSHISSDTENNGRIGMLFGAIANETLTLTANYYLQDDVLNSVGESVVADTSIALTSQQFTCPQHSNDVSCSPASFTNWYGDTPVWDFGNSLQYPALVIQGVSYYLADYDSDGVSDIDDLFPSVSIGILADNDGDGAPDNCDVMCSTKGMTADDDDDNDGVIDLNDAFPLDSAESVDSDDDGLGDNADALPNDASETIDTDGDGVGNNADLDDDNDNVVDTTDAFPLDSSEALDTDLDGVGNNADLDDDNDNVVDTADVFPLDASETTDTDLDGIGNNADTDDDNDGIVDELDGEPLNAAIGDISPPIFNHADAIFIKAQGRLTDISALVEVKALDAVDGEVTAKIVGETLYLSGQHMVELSAEDTAGNIAYYQLELNIKPEVNVISQINVESGGSYALALYLSGEAPHYPVEVLYNIYLNGEVYDEAWANITAGTQGDIKVSVPANLSASDTMSISLEFASPAFIGTEDLAKLTLSDRNFAPLMQTHVTQNGEQVSSIDPDNGLVTIQASVEDINQADQHDIVWSVQDNAFADINKDSQLMTFEVDPSELVEGNYSLDIIVTESNTAPALSVQHTLQLVVEQLAKLALDLDSDNDGINDSEEGYSDSDGDGIADYLDNNSNTTELPSSDSVQPMQTAPGLTMSLGSLVRGVQSKDASLTLEGLADAVGEDAADTQSTDFEAATPLYNFSVGGLSEQGDSVAVVIPLASGTSLPEDAVYRKYNTVNGWFTFVEDENNSVSSSVTDDNGNCPIAYDASYQLGLTAGDNCIQLIIEDGGDNDADFMINGSVEDPGAVMIASVNTDPVITDPVTTEPINTAPVVSINPHQTTFEEGSDITISVQGIDPEEDVLSYRWSQLSGPTVTFDDVTSAQTMVSLPVVDRDEVIELQVSVFDGELTAVTTTTFTVTHIAETVETVEDTESETSSESSGGSINYLFLCLLLLARYQRLKRVR